MRECNEKMERKSAEQVCAEQQSYNSDNAIKCKRWYHILSVATLLASVSAIPVVAADCPKWISIIFAVVIVVSNGFNSLFKFHEKWLYHRNLSELFKAEYNKFTWEIKEYKGLSSEEKKKLFEIAVHDLVDKGNLDLSQLIVSDGKEENEKS